MVKLHPNVGGVFFNNVVDLDTPPFVLPPPFPL
jgi:hypothetical protein